MMSVQNLVAVRGLLGCKFSMVNKTSLLRCCRTDVNHSLFRCWSSSTTKDRASNHDDFDEEPRVVKYTESAAAKYRAEQHLYGFNPDAEPLHPSSVWIIRFFGAVFFIYWCILREENDIDEKLGRSLFETVPHVEAPMIAATIIQYEQQGKSTTELQARYKELTGEEFNSKKSAK